MPKAQADRGRAGGGAARAKASANTARRPGASSSRFQDEDIDDDMAFDSDDDRAYGDFFAAQQAARDAAAASGGAGAGRRGGASNADGAAAAEGDDGDEGGGGDDSDDDSYESLDSDIFAESDGDGDEGTDSDGDARPKAKAAAPARSGVPKPAGVNESMLSESLFPSAVVGSSERRKTAAGAADLLGALADALPAATRDRLDRVGQRQTQAERLAAAAATDSLRPEAEPEDARRADRKQTRAMIARDMAKWKEFLRTQRKCRALKFPLKAPDQDPTASTLGGFANAVQHRQLVDMVAAGKLKKSAAAGGSGKAKKADAAAAAAAAVATPRATPSSSLSAAQALAMQSNLLLGASGYGTTQPQRKAAKDGGSSSKSELGEYVEFDADGEGGPGPAEMRAAREHVGKLKAVLGYEVARRRRLNRIKSKTFRRMLRLEKDKQQQKRHAAEALLNPEQAARRLQERLDRQRAEERVTQRHKNTSKWIQHAKRAAPFDAQAKEAIQDQHRQHSLLMQKMQEPATVDAELAAGGRGGRDGNHSGSDDDAVVDELLAGRGKAALAARGGKRGGAGVDQDAAAAALTPSEQAKQKLSEMAFMTRAREKNTRELDAAADRLVAEVERHRGKGLPAAAAEAAATSGATKEDARSAAARRKFNAPARADGASLPVVSPGAVAATKQAAVNNANRDAAAPSPSSTSAQGAAADGGATRESGTRRQRDDGGNTINGGGGNTGAASTGKQRSGAGSASASATTVVLAPANAAADAQERTRDRQEYLISRAFAQDELDEDFNRKKESQVDHIMKPDDPNASLPGWGEWGGKDAKLNAQHKQRVATNAMQRRMERTTLMSARADAALDNVIINHNVDLVPSKTMLHMVPRPFADAGEFQRSMRQPVGPEWTTPQSFKRQIAPKLSSRAGVAIDPLDASTGIRKKAKTSMRKGAAAGGKLGIAKKKKQKASGGGSSSAAA